MIKTGERAGFIAGVIAVAACFSLYATLGLRIAQGEFLNHWNLLFDLDSGAYKDLLTRPWAEMFDEHLGVLKHPLLTWSRPLSSPWLLLGLSPAQAACLSVASVSTISVVVFWHALRVAGTCRTDATLLSTLFAIGATQLFYGFLPDSYPFAGLTILLVLYFGFQRLHKPGSVPIGFAASGIAAFGVTVTNAAMMAIVDIVGRLHASWPALMSRDCVVALQRLAFEQIRFGAICAIIAMALILITWWEPLLAALGDPIGALKRVYWTQTKGEVTDFSTILLTFFGYTFAAPNFTAVAIPEHMMLDFRDYNMPTAGALALPLWIMLWCGLAVSALWSRPTRPFAIALCGCILFNVLLHADFQFRLSVFLYSGHVWAPIAMTAGIGATAVTTLAPQLRQPLRATLMLLIVLAALNNVPRAWEAATAFDRYPPLLSQPTDNTPAEP